MSNEFGSFGDFSKFLDTVVQANLAKIPALELAAQVVEKAAKEEIGTYQRSNLGDFPAWEELTKYTKEERVRLGYTENDPLLRSGELRDTISHDTDVSGLEAVVGSTDQRLVYLELGTKWMAPRSVLGLAAWRSRKKIVNLIGNITVAALLNVDYGKFGTHTEFTVFEGE